MFLSVLHPYWYPDPTSTVTKYTVPSTNLLAYFAIWSKPVATNVTVISYLNHRLITDTPSLLTWKGSHFNVTVCHEPHGEAVYEWLQCMHMSNQFTIHPGKLVSWNNEMKSALLLTFWSTQFEKRYVPRYSVIVYYVLLQWVTKKQTNSICSINNMVMIQKIGDFFWK